MKTKTINAILSNKFNQWLKSITDDKVRALARENSIITGGCIVSMLLGEDVNDYDIYFRNADTTKAIVEYYIFKAKERAEKLKKGGMMHGVGMKLDYYLNDDKIESDIEFYDRKVKEKVYSSSMPVGDEKFKKDYADYVHDFRNSRPTSTEFIRISTYVKSAGVVVFKGKTKPNTFVPVVITSNAITLSDQIQLINRFYGKPEEIHNNYDFVHTKCWWESWSGKLVCPADSLEAILAKELKYTGSKYPLCSIIRTRKFIKRGWSINGGEYLKMAIQLQKLNLLDIATLQDQLFGVDSTYFSWLIYDIKKQMETNSEFQLTDSYIFDMINKIFNEPETDTWTNPVGMEITDDAAPEDPSMKDFTDIDL